MKRITFGILFLLIGLLIKVLFGHLAQEWSKIEFYSYLFYVVGFITLIYRTVIKPEKKLNKTSKNRIKNWIYKKPFLIYFLLVPIIIILLLSGEVLNTKLKNHYLERNTNETLGEFIGYKKATILIKYTEKAENFALFKYKTEKGTIIQGLKKEEFEKKGKIIRNKIRIIYSVEYPSFFKISE